MSDDIKLLRDIISAYTTPTSISCSLLRGTDALDRLEKLETQLTEARAKIEKLEALLLVSSGGTDAEVIRHFRNFVAKAGPAPKAREILGDEEGK